MSIAIQSISSKTNSTVSFNFDDNVMAYIVGISYWKFAYGGDDHHVRKLALAVNSNQPSSTQVTAMISATLSDDSGNRISDNDSSVRICCVAVLRASDNNIALEGAHGIKSETSSEGLPLPGSALSVGTAFLTGYSLAQGADHHVMRFQASAGFKAAGNQGRITSQAEMSDSSGNASEGYINGGIVAASTPEKGILSLALVNQQTASSQLVDFHVPLKPDAAVMLQSLVAEFKGDDHHVKTIGGGCSGWSVQGSQVKLNDARAFITDRSSHLQDDAMSSVSLVVLALPSDQ